MNNKMKVENYLSATKKILHCVMCPTRKSFTRVETALERLFMFPYKAQVD